MGSPTIFNGSFTKALTSRGLLLSNNSIIENNGAINYIKNGHAEINTTGWATYADTAANIPADGTGGTATGLTFSRSTSSPLVNSASFSMVQANSTSLQGKGVSYDFTIDSGLQASVLSINFIYNASATFIPSNGSTPPLNDGTTTTNAGNSDIEVFVYDVTNAVLIPVNPQVMLASGVSSATFNGSFQAAANSTSYRLILHVATTSANATGWTYKFDQMYVGPQPGALPAQGVVAAISTAATLAFTSGSAIAWTTVIADPYNGFSSGVYTVPVSGTYDVYLEAVITSNDAVNYFVNKNGVSVGRILANDVAMLKSGHLPVTCVAGDTLSIVPSASKTFDYTAPSGTTTGLKPFFTISLRSGAGASVGGDTRLVAASITTAATLAYPSGTPALFTTTLYDTHAAYSSATGLYTAPVSGVYDVTFTGSSTGATSNFFLNVNAASVGRLYPLNSTYGGNAASVKLSAGDTVSLVASGTGTFDYTANSGATTGIRPYFNIARRSGTSSIVQQDSINARYYASATSISGTLATIVWTTKDYDSANSMSSGVYTIPVSGKYQIEAALAISGTFVLNSNSTMEIQKNGTVVSRVKNFAGAAVTQLPVQLSDEISCVAGDTLRIQVSNSGTGPAIVSSNFENYVSLFRTGN